MFLVMVNICAVFALSACAQNQKPVAKAEDAPPVEVEVAAPALLKKFDFAADAPKPKDFVVNSRAKIDEKYPAVGVTPQGRKEQAFTKEQDAQALERLQKAKSTAVRQR